MSTRIDVDRWDRIPMHERIRWLASGPYRDAGETIAEHLARMVRVDPDLDADTADDLAFVLDGIYERLRGGDSLPGYLQNIATEHRERREAARAELEEAQERETLYPLRSWLDENAWMGEDEEVKRGDLQRAIRDLVERFPPEPA